MRIPLHGQLSAPYPQPPRGHPTAKISSMNGSHPAQIRRATKTDPPPQIADLGCGTGWSSVALALAYPAARVDGIDLDEASITEARQNAENSGVADRLQFHRASAGEAVLDGQYDLVTFFETVHDMAYPVAALQAAAIMLATGGAVLV